MRTVGMITTGVAGIAALVAVALGIRSVPDVQRYLRMRAM